MTAHVLADEELAPHFSCAAIAHPSLGYEDNFGGSVVELLNRVKTPILFIPTKVSKCSRYSCSKAHLIAVIGRL